MKEDDEAVEKLVMSIHGCTLDEWEERRMKNRAADYLSDRGMKEFIKSNKFLRMDIMGLIDSIEEYAMQIENIREHLDRTPI